MTNRLGDSLSPYLRSHAENPVDWWPWGEEAFAEARRRQVPVLISIGYAACHWCHVMAHESFEDPQVADLINENFVAVKVDREEHPDVDSVYMLSTQALTGRGGWPMTVFTDPDGRPFYAGTYFPPQPRHGMPAFSQVLQSISATWTANRADVDAASGRIADALAQMQSRARAGAVGTERPGQAGEPPDADSVPSLDDLERISEQAADTLAAEFDQRHAGFGTAPKFPPTMVLQFLLRRYQRCGDPRDLELVQRTCQAMAAGGMYDQLAGGFARYSVDAAWVVPHFEKMLYDNAQLLALYARLSVTDPQHRWRQVAVACGDFLLDQLQVDGGFASALDADAVPNGAPAGARAEEGASYVWTPAQLADALDPADAEFVAALCDVTALGTFEHGSSVLQLSRPPQPGSPDAERWERCRERLLAVRDARPQPARDGKVVVAWNGLVISGLAQAGALLAEPRFVDAAAETADALRARQWVDGRLRRVSLGSEVGDAPGVLEDYACLAQGLIDLYAVTADVRHVAWAGELLEVAVQHFSDGAGGYFDTADDAPRLLLRPSDPSDNASPSGWSALAGAILAYAALTGSARHREAAERALRVPLRLAGTSPRFAGWALAVAEALIAGPAEVAVVGTAGDPDRQALAEAAWRLSSPGAVVAVGLPDGAVGASAQSSVVPLLAHRTLVDGRAAAYVCRGFTCQAPVTDPTALLGLS